MSGRPTSTSTPAFRTVIHPALEQWPSLSAPVADHDRRPTDLLQIVNDNARLLGSEPLAEQGPLWVTGHQAWLWHPGILAKDLAASAAARRYGGQVLHLVVDHDVHNPLALDLPVIRGRRLTSQTLQLAPVKQGLPAACLPPVEMDQALATLESFEKSSRERSPARLDRLRQALTDLPAFETLGQQMAAVTTRLMRPWVGNTAILLTSQLHRLEGFRQILDDMMHNAASCISAYNAAVLAHPQAGIGPLAMDQQFIELPLWLVRWDRGREPVYVDITDSRPLLVTADGREVKVDGSPTGSFLAPRAMLLTALIRRYYARLFIHGTGGGVYDQATEAWWLKWKPGESLAPMAVVTADLRFAFDIPVATTADVQRAIWWLHHLPHNLNHQSDLLNAQARALVEEKDQLLTTLSQSQDREEKALAFRRLHEINDTLASLMPGPLQQARQALIDAQHGLQNHTQANRRDWCFALYDDQSLTRLAHAMGLGDATS